VLSDRCLCDELITRPEESYRLCCVVVCDLETSRIGAPYIYIYDISSLRVKVMLRVLGSVIVAVCFVSKLTNADRNNRFTIIASSCRVPEKIMAHK
jgi:hypothetical protein